MPALAPSMTEGTIARWLKREGDAVKAGEPLVEIETDKAVVEYEARDDGVLRRIVARDGSANVKVDQVIALLEVNAEKGDAPATAPGNLQPPAPPTVAAAVAPPAAGPRGSSVTPPRVSGRTPASPLARRLAAAANIDLAALRGSGPGGRIVKRDVESASPGPAALPVGSAAVPSAVHLCLRIDCDIDALLDMRRELNGWADGTTLTVDDLIIKAAALAMKQVPEANVSWSNGASLHRQGSDVAVAITTASGVVTPVIRQADRKALSQISAEMKEVTERCRNGRLDAVECESGGLTISDLGMVGIREFAATISPPQSCLLALGAGEQRPVARNGTLAIATVMSCTLSADQRVVDGPKGAKFLAAFKRLVEQPMNMLL